MMRRQALLVVEYAKENGRPLEPETWERVLNQQTEIQGVARVEVLEDEPK